MLALHLILLCTFCFVGVLVFTVTDDDDPTGSA